MSTSIVYVSGTGNTKKLAEEIEKTVGPCGYVGKPSEEALECSRIYVGFWTMKFTCPPNIAAFLETLENREVFLFGTAGYDDAPEYFDRILDSVQAHLKPSNRVIGRFLSMGRVSDGKKKVLAAADAEKYQAMLPKLEKADSHPDGTDLANLRALLTR